jgi:4'-phosphopantetheinyl transferase EntD
MNEEEVRSFVSLLAARIAPAEVAGVSIEDFSGGAHPEEEALAATFAAGRSREFLAGRLAAARALAALGAPDCAILRGESGEPLLPEGYALSISHGAGLALAAAARKDALSSLGIDVETTGRLSRKLWRRIFTPSEAASLAAAPDPAALATAAFSAKEALYKAAFPLSGRGVEMKQVELSFFPDGVFRARIANAAALGVPAEIAGFVLVTKEATAAFAAIPAIR